MCSALCSNELIQSIDDTAGDEIDENEVDDVDDVDEEEEEEEVEGNDGNEVMNDPLEAAVGDRRMNAEVDF